MLELHFVEREISNPSAKVVWCGDRETLKEIEKMNNPLLLVSVCPVSEGELALNKEARFLFPFKDGVGYLSFFSKGENKVQAVVIDSSMKEAKKWWLAQSNRTYDSEMIDTETGLIASSWRERLRGPQIAPQIVSVPDGVFAKEPSEWEKAWVLWLVNDKGEDRCAFRQRMWFAYSFQPIILLVRSVVILSATLVSLLLGKRGFSLRFLLHPLTIDIVDAFDGSYGEPDLFHGGSIFIRKLTRDQDPLRGVKSPFTFFNALVLKFWPCLFHPLLWLPVLVLGVLGRIHILSSLLFVLGVVILFAIMGCLILGTVVFVLDRKDEREKLGPSKPLVPITFDELVCTGEVKIPKKQSVKLRFLDLKSKVCRPFSR